MEITNKMIDDKYNVLELRLSEAEERLSKLEIKAKKRANGEFNAALRLAEIKSQFLESRPHDRTDPFNDWELVMWASYLLSGTSRREKLDSIAEIAKRSARIRGLVEHFKSECLTSARIDTKEEDCENWARLRVKSFLEMMLLGYPKAWDGQPMTFYIATSDYSINNYGSKLALWQQTNRIEDRPPKDDED